MHLGFECHVTGEATAPAVRKGECIMLICGSGRTPVSKGFAEIAAAEGVKLIVVTHKPDSEIAGLADVLLKVPMRETVEFGGTVAE
jgi:6-phospho-3-hexuloisomerase